MEPIVIALWVLCAAFSATVAGDKGYNRFKWALAGLVFGPMGFLSTLGLPDLKQRKYLRLLCEHHGASDNSTVSQQDGDYGDADAQRRRILGKK